jgi:two-component system, cell cycle sensor histidine kinase and response regulator CckA
VERNAKDKPEKRKRIMRRTASKQHRYRQLLDSLPDAVLVTTRGVIRYANRAAVEMLCVRSSAELRGALYNDFVLSASPLSNGSEQHRLRRADGTIIDVEAIMRGAPSARRIVLRDLSRVVANETVVQRTEERLALTAEQRPERAIITLDPIGYISHWNPAAERLTGYPAESILGRALGTLFLHDQPVQQEDALLRAAIETGSSDYEGWHRKADGSQFYGCTSVTALFDRDGKVHGFALVLRDLAPGANMDGLHNEEQMRQAQRMEAVGRLASGIAHDFNNLLTAIHGHAQFLIEDLPHQDPSRADAEEILHSAERAASLTRQLLAFSRGQTTQPQAVDLNHVVTSMERLLRRVISENITLTAMLDPELSLVRADPSQIEQILVNLIVNARDAMPDGGEVTIKTANAELADSYAARREEVEPGSYVMLAVSDTGVGMDLETQTHIFEPFFTTKAAGKGTGLGLSTVYGIVKQSGGHIFVYSEPGHGTTFKIYLPCTRAQVAQRTPGKKKAQRAHAGETIILVEDDAAVRGLAKRVLEARGYDVEVAASANEAMDVLKHMPHHPSLLITDVILPDTTGISLIEKVRDEMPECRVLLMSGYTSEDVRRQGEMAADAEFIEKPFTPDAFAEKVRSVLDAD